MALARARRPQYVKKFTRSDWVNNKIEIIPTGVPVSGQLGPHELPISDFYETAVYKQMVNGSFLEWVGTHISQHLNGKVIVIKAPRAENFDGVIMIKASRYE